MTERRRKEGQRQKALDMVDSGIHPKQVAEHLKVHPGTVYRWVQQHEAVAGRTSPDDSSILVEVGDEDNSRIIKCRNATSVEDVLEQARVDLDIWEVEKVRITSSDVTMKLRSGDGKKYQTEVHHDTNWHVQVHLKRRLPRETTNWLERRASRAVPKAFPAIHISSKHPKRPKMLEVLPCDTHFGKVAYAVAGGLLNYNLDTARHLFSRAIGKIAERAAIADVEEVLFIFGNDFLHVDNWRHTTTNGTQQDVDRMFSMIWDAGADATIEAIEMLAGIAPVKVIHVPGNHDRDASRAIAKYAEAWFRDCPHITFDIGHVTRKYHLYGRVLLGFTHGNEEPHKELPLIMAREAREEWGRHRFAEIHTGHFHKRASKVYHSSDTHTGVVVRTISSLSSIDEWHHRVGFPESLRAMEAFLWDPEHGLDTQINVNVEAILEA